MIYVVGHQGFGVYVNLIKANINARGTSVCVTTSSAISAAKHVRLFHIFIGATSRSLIQKASGKQCTCAQWDEAFLLRAAEERMRAQGRAPAAPEARRARVQVIAEELRENHECRHPGGFRYDEGGGRCAGCRNRLPSYLFQCGACFLRICNRCRHNRF